MPSRFRRPSRRPFLLTLVGLCLLTSAGFNVPGVAAAPKSRVKPVEGIDVSHWQGAIDWNKVAHAGKKFAFMKASESTNFTDPKFATYRAGAGAAGVAIGAYHYAQPNLTPGDAVAEADWFISQIGSVAANDLRPALDLEVTNSMTADQLTQWTLDWLNEVYTLTGRRPFVFTTNSFWNNKMGNTQAVAQAGYGLWISYGGGGNSPTVPAGNWGATSWSVWKYDNCGTVSGISGCVDLDRLHGTDMTAFR